MRDFIISTDSTADLPEDYIKKHNLFIHPLYYMLDDIVYGEEHQLTPKEFYAIMRSGKMPTTMATNPDFIRNAFVAQLEAGFDILHIGFSSALSSSFSNATVVANELREEYKEANIVVIDSLCASMGQGLFVHKALMMKEAGKSMNEIIAWLGENIDHICHEFTVDDLFHLHRGGRVSKTSAIIGTLINVKPILNVDANGKLVPVENVRGRKKALTTLVDHMGKKIEGYDNDVVFISHGDCESDAEFVANLIRERYQINHFLISYVTPTVGAHSGPGTVALFFMGSER